MKEILEFLNNQTSTGASYRQAIVMSILLLNAIILTAIAITQLYNNGKGGVS